MNKKHPEFLRFKSWIDSPITEFDLPGDDAVGEARSGAFNDPESLLFWVWKSAVESAKGDGQ